MSNSKICIFKGNFSNVYLINDKIIKTIKINNHKENIITELLILSSKLSKYIASLDYFDIHKNHIEIVMPYYENGTLEQFVRNIYDYGDVFTETTLWRFFLELSNGLSVLHRHNIIHRDMKSSNILVSSTFQLVISDFNISKILQKNQYASTFVGTPLYMSPELVNGKQYKFEIDIWGLGCILYECITGKSPFYSKNWGQLIHKITNLDIPKIDRNDISNLLKNWCKKLLQNRRPCIDTIIKSLASQSLLYNINCDTIVQNKDFLSLHRKIIEADSFMDKYFIIKDKDNSEEETHKINKKSNEDNNSIENSLIIKKSVLHKRPRKI